jgi:predicted metal-dependent phosphoesterase TrpH
MNTSTRPIGFDPYSVNVDLHCHSNMSDGVLDPADLMIRAHANGVDWIALTDHDEVAGLQAAGNRARELGMGFIPGVEVSVTWAGQTIHVVGLRIDPDDAELRAGLVRTRGGRDTRAMEISEALAKVGIAGAYEGALQFAGNPSLIGRNHFARYLVQIGRCADVREVFESYLIEGKPGFVPHRWARLQEAITWIRKAGGMAVLAHPARYRFTEVERLTFLEEFVAAGGEGIEVVTSAHTVEETRRYVGLARQFGLKASRGSDFHGPGESRVDLGKLPPLPDSVIPVWASWGIG